MFTRALALTALLAPLLIAAPALAQPAAPGENPSHAGCVWDHLPDGLRGQVIAAYRAADPAEGASGAGVTALLAAHVPHIIKASRLCHLRGVIKRAPLTDYITLVGEVAILNDAGVPEPALVSAWAAQPAARKLRFVAIVAQGGDAGGEDLAFEKSLLHDLLVSIPGVSQANSQDAVLYYVYLAHVAGDETRVALSGMHPGAVGCVWARLSPAVQAQAMDADRSRTSVSPLIAAHSGEVAVASGACGLTGLIEAADLSNYALTRRVAAETFPAAGLTEDAVIQAFTDAPDRERLFDVLAQDTPSPADSDFSDKALFAIVKALKITSRDVYVDTARYLTAVVRLDRAEGSF